jgi:hypothetical protein
MSERSHEEREAWVRALASAHTPEEISRVLGAVSPGSSAWWAALSPEEQQRILAAFDPPDDPE